MNRKMETGVLTVLFVLLAALLLILAKEETNGTEYRGAVELPQNVCVIETAPPHCAAGYRASCAREGRMYGAL